MLYDQGAQEYAANQTREEARHVTAFAKYIKARWGRPVAASAVLQNLLVEIISAPEVYKKIIGMQMLVEGLAMGAFATFFQKLQRSARPQADAARDDRRGLPPQVREDLGRPHRAETLARGTRHRRGLGRPLLPGGAVQPRLAVSEQRDLYEEFGLDPDIVLAEIQKLATDEARREDMKNATNIFRVLIKTLLNAGIITDRTRGFYGMYVDMEELRLEGDRMVGDDIAEEGIAYLKTINFRDRTVAQAFSLAAE